MSTGYLLTLSSPCHPWHHHKHTIVVIILSVIVKLVLELDQGTLLVVRNNMKDVEIYYLILNLFFSSWAGFDASPTFDEKAQERLIISMFLAKFIEIAFNICMIYEVIKTYHPVSEHFLNL